MHGIPPDGPAPLPAHHIDLAGLKPQVKALRLVCVDDVLAGQIHLVSLELGCVIATGESFGVGNAIRCVKLGEAQVHEAWRLAGLEPSEQDGLPGWDVLLPYLALTSSPVRPAA